MKKIVIALGGNALGKNPQEQKELIKIAAKNVADVIELGYKVVIVHGNGPQVGFISTAMDNFAKENSEYKDITLADYDAMSQGYIGYDLQNALREELLNRSIDKNVVSILTQIEVDEHDPAFNNPTKPIGRFMDKVEAESLIAQNIAVMEDAGRGYRKVVASPKPKEIIELNIVNTLIENGTIVITCGGGGIPVIKKDNTLTGVPAVIDKDFAAALLAKSLDADILMILTAVPNVYINFGKENQEALGKIEVATIESYIKTGDFKAGSMLPKVEAAISFSKSSDNKISIITDLTSAVTGVKQEIGTIIK
ncbi:MAG: carbamate kinase [Sarcina sp.]